MAELEEDGVLFSQLQETLASDPDNPSHHFNLGLFLWKKGEGLESTDRDESKRLRERSAECFLASAKLNPSDGASFRFLGHYYGRGAPGDTQRASKCYQRAVNLNPDDSEAGEGLCDLLDRDGKESLEIAVCREASEKSPRAFWAFRRLGYLLVHQKKWSEALQSLQHAIRGYPGCSDLWEALGLAYRNLGMYTAAIKSYGRAIELEDSRVFALIESGNILLMLGSFRKGIEQFHCALQLAPSNVSAHFGLAHGLLGLSKECTSSGAFCWGSTLLEEASKVAQAGTHLSGNFSSLWKLHGDIKSAYAKSYPWDGGSSVEIDERSFKVSIEDWKKTCLLAATDAKRLYQRALHLTPWQANIYTDIAISLDLIDSLEEKRTPEPDVWQLPEKMSVGSLMLEGVNSESWVILGSLSKDNALKQHALIRGLQLDASLSVAWAYLGKHYRKLGEKHLAVQAFDRARSIDPSLALPWAGMAVDSCEGAVSEAYESCLRAVQTLPLAEFQVGLGKLAVLSGHLLSPQVFGAIRQAVLRAPHYAESHNLNGLVCEARSDYQSAIAAYRRSRCALNIAHDSNKTNKSHYVVVSVNLARALCLAGYYLDAASECENMKNDGFLDASTLQIYAVTLWKLGKSDLALATAKTLTENISTMKQSCADSSISLICTLLYQILGQNPTASFILKLPMNSLRTAKMNLIVTAISSLDPTSRLQLLQHDLQKVASCEVVTELHTIIAISKMIGHGSKQNLEICSGVHYLRRVLHMYPGSILIRNHLSSLLLSCGDWTASHRATRCAVIPTGYPSKMGLKSPFEILGSAGVACYASCTTSLQYSFPTCEGHLANVSPGIHHLRRWLHQEPWSHEARYLLVLNLMQKAREQKFPRSLCVTLKRLLLAALSKELYDGNEFYKYSKFLLLLVASEISLQCGDFLGCIDHTNNALELLPPNSDPFFAHLQLCRVYAAKDDLENLRSEYMNCLHVKTVNQIGWITLKYLESRYKLQKDTNVIDVNLLSCSAGKGYSWKWEAVFDLVRSQGYIWDQDFLSAEQVLAHACSLGPSDSCLLLCHGAICMELARQRAGSEFLSRAVVSLTKAQETSHFPLPIVSVLLAQAEASLGSRSKWERNLRIEWFSWPAEMRPAELYFQMHLLAKQSSAVSNQKQASIESSESPERWILRAIHLNPSCLRYWKVLQKLIGT